MTHKVRRLLPYLLRYRNRLLAGVLCVIMTAGIGLLAPWILKYAVDDLHRGVTASKLAWYAGLTLGVSAVGGLFRFLMRRIIIGVSRLIEYDLRNDFFAHLQRLSMAYYHAQRTGDLMSRATNDLNAVRMMIGPAIMYSATTIITFITAVVLMLSIDAKLTGLALLPLPFVSISVKYFGSSIHRQFEEIQAELSNLSAVVQEALSGVRVVKAYVQERPEIERFRRANLKYIRRNRGLIRLQGFFFPTMEIFLGLGALLILWLGSRAVVAGEITLGEFVAFNAYLAMLSWPMIAFGWVTNMFQRGMASWGRMLQILETPPQITDAEADPAIRAIAGGIEVRHLTFAYRDGAPPVLRDVNLRIEPGMTVAIVGATGSGKSTLVNLVPRYFDAPGGQVLIDGVDIRRIPLGVLRGSIGYVPQEPFLFSDTVEDNVAFGLAEAVANQVREAAAIARLDVDAEEFPAKYKTLVGERGITLSGGQKQRTAIARALILSPKILILDDALSAVDTYTEEEILSRLRGVMRSRTTLIVSHRISTVRDADLIVVLDQGHIVERGGHDDLVARDGIYAALYRKQLLEEELAAS